MIISGKNKHNEEYKMEYDKVEVASYFRYGDQGSSC